MKCKIVNWYFFCLIFQFSPVRVLSWWKKKISYCYSQYLRLGRTRHWSCPRSCFCLSGVFIPEFKTCRFLWLSKLGILFNGQKALVWFFFFCEAPFKVSNFVFSWRFWALFCRDARLNDRILLTLQSSHNWLHRKNSGFILRCGSMPSPRSQAALRKGLKKNLDKRLVLALAILCRLGPACMCSPKAWRYEEPFWSKSWQ